MSKELSPSLRSLALQIALQLPDDQREAISVLRYAREIVERSPEKLGHAVRTSDIGVARRGKALPSSLAADRRPGSSSK
jgi:hypothetical protein